MTNPVSFQKPPLILVVEDELKLAEIVLIYLTSAGFDTLFLSRGGTVVQTIKSKSPDLLVLDLWLPEKDGLAICKEVREFSNIPILMTTAQVEESQRLAGFEAGADDYLCKPFSPRELVARVQALLRRQTWCSGGKKEAGFYDDAAGQRILYQGVALPLTPREYQICQKLLSRPGRVYSRQELLDSLYEDNLDVTDRVLDSHMKNIRKKIAAVCPEGEFIFSVYGVGYKWGDEGGG